MRAADLSRRVGFYRRVAINDGAGNTQGRYGATPEFVVFANVRPRLGGESVLAGRLAGTKLVNVTVRRSSSTVAVDETWMARDVNGGASWNIRSVIDPDEGTRQAGAWIEMLCEEGASDVAQSGA